MVDDHDFGHGDYFAGSPETTTNQSLLVTVSDDIDNRLYMDFPFGRNGISMRDANTLNFIRTVESPVPNWNVAICGRLGCEIIVTSNPAGLSAFRGDQRKVWSLNSNETLRGAQGSHAFPILGCENHLLVVTCYRVYLFKVGAGDEDLVVQKMAVPIGGSDTESRVSKACSPPENVAWSPCRAYFSFYDKQTRQICIWEYSDENESITPINSISAGDLSITTVALSESYVIGTSSQKKFSVWDHQSGKLCHRELCDVVDTTGGDSDSENDELIWALRMFVVDGDFLAATSRQGNALCFWNLRKGKLLKRHTDAFEKIADELPDGVDVTSMEHLIDLNAFVCMQGTMMVWAFPSNTKQKKKIASIRRREKSIASVQTQDLFY
jgi:WD40 repeat protein